MLSLAFASCSQDVEYACAEQERTEESSSQCIEGLTRDLRALNARYRAQDTAVQRAPKVTYTKSDMVKIAIADVKGALRGTGGGPGGMVVGAATASLIKFGKITLKKYLEGILKDNAAKPRVYRSNSLCAYADSVGYYHNEVEYAMYSSDRGSCNRGSLELVSEANARLMSMSSGFHRDGGLTAGEQLSVSSAIDAIRSVDDSQSFTSYCASLKDLNPEDAAYIDYCAEYIYTAVYANLSSLEEYTAEVMYQIQHSNVDVQDRQRLFKSVQVAYASILYSQNMKFTSIDNP